MDGSYPDPCGYRPLAGKNLCLKVLNELGIEEEKLKQQDCRIKGHTSQYHLLRGLPLTPLPFREARKHR